jgi:hypothetical protein
MSMNWEHQTSKTSHKNIYNFAFNSSNHVNILKQQNQTTPLSMLTQEFILTFSQHVIDCRAFASMRETSFPAGSSTDTVVPASEPSTAMRLHALCLCLLLFSPKAISPSYSANNSYRNKLIPLACCVRSFIFFPVPVCAILSVRFGTFCFRESFSTLCGWLAQRQGCRVEVLPPYGVSANQIFCWGCLP